MWKLYCLPGRVIAELGYLFPGKGQLWASQRRRESGCAAFLFATGFWAAFGFFALPVIAPLIAAALGLGHTGPRQNSHAAQAELPVQGASSSGVIATERSGSPRANTQPGVSSAPQLEEGAKPRVVFAPPREVVQALPAATSPAPAN